MDEAQSAVYFVRLTVAAIMLAMGLGLSTEDFRRVFEDPRGVTVGLVAQMLGLPIFGLVCAVFFQLPSELAVGIILLTACPGGAHSNLFSNLAHGDTALSVTLTAVTGILTIVTIPLWTSLALTLFGGSGAAVSMPFADTMLEVLLMMAIPVTVGMGIRWRLPSVADYAEKAVKLTAVLLLLLIVVGSVTQQAERVGALFAMAGLPVLVLNVGAMMAGWGIGKLGRLPIRQQLTVVIEVGIQNSALAVGLAMGLLGDVYAIPAIIYSLLVYLTGAVVIGFGRMLARTERSEG